MSLMHPKDVDEAHSLLQNMRTLETQLAVLANLNDVLYMGLYYHKDHNNRVYIQLKKNGRATCILKNLIESELMDVKEELRQLGVEA